MHTVYLHSVCIYTLCLWWTIKYYTFMHITNSGIQHTFWTIVLYSSLYRHSVCVTIKLCVYSVSVVCCWILSCTLHSGYLQEYTVYTSVYTGSTEHVYIQYTQAYCIHTVHNNTLVHISVYINSCMLLVYRQYSNSMMHRYAYSIHRYFHFHTFICLSVSLQASRVTSQPSSRSRFLCQAFADSYWVLKSLSAR